MKLPVQTVPKRLLFFLLLPSPSAGSFLLVSSPSGHAVHYAKLLGAEELVLGERMKDETLELKDGALEHPLGLAVDNVRAILYVADPGAKTVVAMRIYAAASGETLYVEDVQIVLTNVAVHWVAVDSVGTLLCSDTDGNQIWTLPASYVEGRLAGEEDAVAVPEEGDTAPPNNKNLRKLYSGSVVTALRMPQGLAAGSSRIFWANGEGGQTDGAVLRGPEDLPEGSADSELQRLAVNTDAAYGLCLTSSRVFYTARTGKVFTTRRNGGDVVTVTDSIQAPRGCAFDGDSTVYVADSTANKVYSFSGAAAHMGPRRLSLALEVQDPYGVAIFARSAAARSGGGGGEAAGRALPLAMSLVVGALGAFGGA